MRGTLRGSEPDLPPAEPHPAAYPRQGYSRKAVAAFALTLVGLAVAPIAFSTTGIILAFIARNETARNPAQRGRGLATAALVIGSLGLVAGIAVAIVNNS